MRRSRKTKRKQKSQQAFAKKSLNNQQIAQNVRSRAEGQINGKVVPQVGWLPISGSPGSLPTLQTRYMIDRRMLPSNCESV